MGLSSASANGALVGLVVGALNYVLALSVVARVGTRGLSEDESVARRDFARRMLPIKRVLMATSFLVFPLVGYAAGAMMSPGGVAR
ncbi:MAG: hypothetical protein JWN93_149 [Hyphomicrobiales bacterium]|nr:hypothetical protein [Hyphomicrobiales bacterium]